MMIRRNSETQYFVRLLAILGFLMPLRSTCHLSLDSHHIIPEPQIVRPSPSKDFFYLQSSSIIYSFRTLDSKFSQILGDILLIPTGWNLTIKKLFEPLSIVKSRSESGFIFIKKDFIEEFQSDEGYKLDISPNWVTVTATEDTGFFYGIQTIRQMFNFMIDSPGIVTDRVVEWALSTGVIIDYPEFSYRGAMLDVARHFFSVDDVKHYIDFISRYKMNILHLHLSDDQGWRIEIKSRPRLTEIGALYEVGGGNGSFYTQAEYLDIIAFGASRFVTIIPEIDMVRNFLNMQSII